jgi:hypothetical protein
MMTEYDDLIRKHGTYNDFLMGLETAFNQGFCTWGEKEEASEKYRIELKEALERQQKKKEVKK